MALIRITRRCPLPPREAWRRLTRWERHAALVPLTRIVVETPPPNGPGTRFTARTGVGAAGFDDPMEIVRWRPPGPGTAGRCRLVKRGRVVAGWAQIEVGPDGAGCAVCWTEDIRVRWLPGAFDPLTTAVGRWMFGRTVDGLLAVP